MLQMLFTTVEREGQFIAGAAMRYQGREHIKKVVIPTTSPLSKVDRERMTASALEEILGQLKRPCRIDLRTDHYRLLESRWAAQPKDSLAGRHQITWSLVPPTSQAILGVQDELRRQEESVEIAEHIFWSPLHRASQPSVKGIQ